MAGHCHNINKTLYIYILYILYIFVLLKLYVWLMFFNFSTCSKRLAAPASIWICNIWSHSLHACVKVNSPVRGDWLWKSQFVPKSTLFWHRVYVQYLCVFACANGGTVEYYVHVTSFPSPPIYTNNEWTRGQIYNWTYGNKLDTVHRFTIAHMFFIFYWLRVLTPPRTCQDSPLTGTCHKNSWVQPHIIYT